MNQFLWGALAMGCLVSAVLFARFWQVAKERLFLFFALAFCCFALNWIALGLIDPGVEERHFVYLPRLLGFLFIIWGIVDKNRRTG